MNKLSEIVRFTARPINEAIKKRGVRTNNIYLNYVKHRPIMQDSVLFESYHAVNLTGNPYAVYQKMLELRPTMQFFWAYRDKNTVPTDILQETKGSHVHLVRYGSTEYLKMLATVQYLVNDTSFMPYFIKRDGQRYLNTWHGTPLKTLGLDIKDAGRSDHKNIQRNLLSADVLAMPNQFTADRLIKSHDLNGIFPNEVYLTGNARVDNTLAKWTKKETTEFKATYNLPDTKIILYAPTWKKEIRYTTDLDIMQLLEEVEQLQSKAPKGYTVLLKVHYFIYDKLVEFGYRDRVVPNSIDTNQLLNVVDMLITDYSSIFFDYLPLKRPIMFYVPDKESYAIRRGFYKELDTLPGLVTDKFQQILISLEMDYGQQWAIKYQIEINAYQQEFLSLDDGHASERTVKVLLKPDEDQTIKRLSYQNNKQKLLLYAGGFYNNGITNSVINLVTELDSTKYELVFMDYPKMRAEKEYNMNRLPKNVHFIFNFSWMSRTILDTYNQNLSFRFGYDFKWVSHTRMKRAYQLNFKRLFGNFVPDEAIDFGGYNKAMTGLFALSKVKRKVIFLHNVMQAEYDKKVNGKFKHRQNLKVIFSYYKYFDKIVSVSKSASDQNKQDLMQYAKRANFTWVENLVNGTEIEAQLADVTKQKASPTYDNRIKYFEEESDSQIITSKSFKVLDQNYFSFVTIARLSPEKNHHGLIQAFKMVHDHYPNARLYIVGNGPLFKKLSLLISDLGLENAVFLMGFLENPIKFSSFADYVVLPSLYEGQGLAILEALIAKKPVIGTDVAGIKDALDYGKLGLLASRESLDNPSILANVLALAIETKDQIKHTDHKVTVKPAINWTISAKENTNIFVNVDETNITLHRNLNLDDTANFTLTDDFTDKPLVQVDYEIEHVYVQLNQSGTYPNLGLFINGRFISDYNRYEVQVGNTLTIIEDMKQQVVFNNFDWQHYNQQALQQFEERVIKQS